MKNPVFKTRGRLAVLPKGFRWLLNGEMLRGTDLWAVNDSWRLFDGALTAGLLRTTTLLRTARGEQRLFIRRLKPSRTA